MVGQGGQRYVDEGQFISTAGILSGIDGSLHLLRKAGASTEDWTMCFAYGSRDERSLRLLRERGCALGLTTDPRVATLEDDPLQLPRLDTNDLPVEVVERA